MDIGWYVGVTQYPISTIESPRSTLPGTNLAGREPPLGAEVPRLLAIRPAHLRGRCFLARPLQGRVVRLSAYGFVYSALGEKQQALAHYAQALPLRRQVRDKSGEATTLNR
ncbi:MAG: hypothetical protein HY328_12470 [Chloroflexi bacterium]|nr:hypothetical protein [Chloroflexota bacterium]